MAVKEKPEKHESDEKIVEIEAQSQILWDKGFLT